MKLSELIKQDTFRNTRQEVLLNVIVTSSWVTSELAATMAPYGITPSQYNALRILRGSHPKTLTCSEVGARLLDRTPDVTRLLNRLERSGLVKRCRSEEDRRVVNVVITEQGLALLDRMRDEMLMTEERITEHLSPEEQRQLCDLLERLRLNQAE